VFLWLFVFFGVFLVGCLFEISLGSLVSFGSGYTNGPAHDMQKGPEPKNGLHVVPFENCGFAEIGGENSKSGNTLAQEEQENPHDEGIRLQLRLGPVANCVGTSV